MERDLETTLPEAANQARSGAESARMEQAKLDAVILEEVRGGNPWHGVHCAHSAGLYAPLDLREVHGKEGARHGRQLSPGRVCTQPFTWFDTSPCFVQEAKVDSLNATINSVSETVQALRTRKAAGMKGVSRVLRSVAVRRGAREGGTAVRQ